MVTDYKITILIRVYNRIEDLVANLKIIRELWKKYNKSHIIVTFNGKKDGFNLPNDINSYADNVIILEENLGHLKGNSQLIKEGYNLIPKDTDILILLESDTWLFDENIIEKYIDIMRKDNVVWCSSEWSRRSWSLGLDLAIINFQAIKEHYMQLFDFEVNPEQWVADNLIKRGLRFEYITELMPVHIPRVISSIFRIKDRRLHVFLKGKMVTHHVEHLKYGIDEKYAIANCLLENPFFQTKIHKNRFLIKLIYNFLYVLINITPQSSWFRKKRHYFLYKIEV